MILKEKIKIDKIVPRYSKLAGNITFMPFMKGNKNVYYSFKNKKYSEADLKKKILEAESSDELSIWSLIEIEQNTKQVYCKAFIEYTDSKNKRGTRFFNSDEKLNFFLEYNSNMIEFV